MLDSPCISVCVLTADGQLCTGCGRTLAEIAGWGVAGADQRAAILAQLPARLLELGDSGET